MVAYAKQWHIRVVASSNLSVPVDREYLERLVRSGLDKLKVGMEGTTQEQYERYRVRGNLDRIARALQLALGGDGREPRRIHLALLRRGRSTV